MKKNSAFLLDIFLRYFLIIIVGIFAINIFYLIFSSFTIYPSFFLLKLFFQFFIEGNSIIMGGLKINLIGACIAGSAYYLLFILNLSTPEIKLKKRILYLLFAFLTFLIFNILRIFFLSLLAISGNSLFDPAHYFFWYFLSTVFVAGIWFAEIKIFKIKNIPFYSDLKKLYDLRKTK